MLDKDNSDRKNAMLTPDQRRGLLNEWRGFQEDRNSKSYHQREMVDRVKHTLRDFRVLEDGISEKRRNEIFDADTGSGEFNELQLDIAAAIAFMYAGLGGESGFRRPLEMGIANGERTLGNVEHALDVSPQFRVERAARRDKRKAVDTVESGTWEDLQRPELFEFVKMAVRADAIDFEAVRERMEYEEYVHQMAAEKASDK